VRFSLENRWRIAVGIFGVLFLLVGPQIFELFTIINLTTAIALAVLALSLGLVWGYGGILCFGQTAFFGLGAYAYTISAINFGGSTEGIFIAVLVGAVAAAILGYFIIYGRVSDVYLAVITLTFTLILYSLLRRTSGPEYKIGDALLGGFNGITSPPLNIPGDTSSFLFPEDIFYVGMVVLILAYFGCVWLTQTHFGRVIVAIRENELRAELLGYDIRVYKLAVFSIGGGLAGLAGVLFAVGIGRVTPDIFNLYNAALTIIWVIVGGRGTLMGPIIGAFGFFYLTFFLGTQSLINNNLVLGIIMIIFVLVVPNGLVPELGRLWRSVMGRRSTSRRERKMRRRTARRPTKSDQGDETSREAANET
jgi:ABC-type branched-subunit amino acid transport system permease subunit